MTKSSSSLQHRLERHFVTCSTVTGAALALSSNQSAQAAITYVVPGAPIAIPETFEGIYFNLETGVADPSPAGAPGWDVNPYGTGNLTWYAATATGSAVAASAAAGGVVVDVPAMTDLSTLTYDAASYNQLSNGTILAGGTFYVAMTFVDGASGTNQAWIEITTSAPDGTPAQINRWAYAPIGESLAAGQTAAVPEPGSAALALLAAGAVGMRRRRAA